MRLFAPATRAVALTAGLSLAAAVLVPLGASLPASANPAGTGLVISEVYGGGGNTGATYTHDFIELYNPTADPIAVDGLSVQYRSSGGTAAATGVTALTGSVPAGGHYLVQQAKGSSGTTPLPTPDATGAIAMSGAAFTVFLAEGTTAINPGTGAVSNVPGVLDLVGVGSNVYETATTAAITNSTSAARKVAGVDTDNNSADFAGGAPTPTSALTSTPTATATATATTSATATATATATDTATTTATSTATSTATAGPAITDIAAIQGSGAASPLNSQIVTTRGVVTANYPAGGFNGFFIQTPGTGGATDATPGASDGLFVYGSGFDENTIAVGDYVEVTGKVSEYFDLTQITAATGSAVVKLSDTVAPIIPAAIAYPRTVEEREAHEGELLAPTGAFTVTNNYTTNQYAEIGLAAGTTPLRQPTDVAPPGSAEALAVAADNAARAVALDDGASINFLPFGGGANQNIALPWLSQTNPVRVNSAVTFKQPVVLDYRNNTWKFQPTRQITDDGTDVVSVEDTRAQNLAPRKVGGNLTLATFNVLNYFNTTGQAFVAAGGTCTYYNDRAGNPIANNTCNPDGPRGAATTASFERQQAKIVLAINTMDADIVSLEEIENSIKLIGEKDRDDAIRALVEALNTQAGTTRWAYAPSPEATALPPLAEQDVIRTGFIYNPAKVDLVGASEVLLDSAPFANAREPLAQAFKAKGAPETDAFVVVVNHFKSKGGTGTGDNLDLKDGAGSFNGDRTRQAQALVSFANAFAAKRGTDRIFLAGDFNSYSQEDPMKALYAGGFSAVESDDAGDETYSFSGLWGSLDHVLANPAARAWVSGADVWQINANEPIAFQYSRYNYNAKQMFDATNVFASSDHNPEVIGINTPPIPVVKADSTTSVSVDPASVTVNSGKSTLTVSVSTADGPAAGDVEVLVGGTTYAATLVDGKASVVVGPFATTGEKVVTVNYLGNDTTKTSTSSVTITVTAAKVASRITGNIFPGIVISGMSSQISATVRGAGTPTGTVTAVLNGTTIGQGTLSGGKTRFRTTAFQRGGFREITLNYSGDAANEPSSTTVWVWVWGFNWGW